MRTERAESRDPEGRCGRRPDRLRVRRTQLAAHLRILGKPVKALKSALDHEGRTQEAMGSGISASREG